MFAIEERYRSGHNGAASKADGRKPRGFESHPLRQFFANTGQTRCSGSTASQAPTFTPTFFAWWIGKRLNACKSLASCSLGIGIYAGQIDANGRTKTMRICSDLPQPIVWQCPERV